MHHCAETFVTHTPLHIGTYASLPSPSYLISWGWLQLYIPNIKICFLGLLAFNNFFWSSADKGFST